MGFTGLLSNYTENVCPIGFLPGKSCQNTEQIDDVCEYVVVMIDQ